MKKLRVKRFHPEAKLPVKPHPTDAGLDFFATDNFTIFHGNHISFRTGIGIALEQGYVGLILDRSSRGIDGIKTLGGVIDANYRGELTIILANVSGEVTYEINAGEKVAQLIIVPVVTPEIEEVDEFEDTDRGINGFGSTGR